MKKGEHVSLDQMNELLNDSFETYFPKMTLFKGKIHGILSLSLLVGLRLRRRIFGGRLIVNERIVEYPLIFQLIRTNGIVLDIGCASSRLPIQLASLGYKVHAVDIRPYAFKHPNLEFYKEDIFKWSPQQYFDIIILVSTLEHFGLGSYGDLVLPEADKEAVDRISDWLSEGGQLLVSVPFGKAKVNKKQRIYDLERLKYIFYNFKWVDQKYFRRVKGQWLPSSAKELKNIPSNEESPNGVAILNLEKIKSGRRKHNSL